MFDFHINWTPETSDKWHLIEAIRQSNEFIKYINDPTIINNELKRIEYLRLQLKKHD